MQYGQVLTDLMTKLDLHNLDILGVVLPCALAFLGGYLVYIFCMIILFKEHTSCYPYWMHTFYFACDLMGGIFWIKLATMTGNFWAFYAFGICMFIWVILEIICMYFSAKWERQEVFGSFFKGEVTMGKAAGTYIVQILMWMFVIANFIHMLGGFADAAFFKLYFWTNLMVPLLLVLASPRCQDRSRRLRPCPEHHDPRDHHHHLDPRRHRHVVQHF